MGFNCSKKGIFGNFLWWREITKIIWQIFFSGKIWENLIEQSEIILWYRMRTYQLWPGKWYIISYKNLEFWHETQKFILKICLWKKCDFFNHLFKKRNLLIFTSMKVWNTLNPQKLQLRTSSIITSSVSFYDSFLLINFFAYRDTNSYLYPIPHLILIKS